MNREDNAAKVLPRLSAELGISAGQIAAVAKLLKEGNTIPFIARYRKEVHGNLDEVQISKVQERLTLQIKECIQNTLNPLGVMVVVEAQHLCMQMRGIKKQNSITTTSDFCGAFNQAKTREEFMNLLRNK